MPEIKTDRGWMPDFFPYSAPEGALTIAKDLVPYDNYYSPWRNKVIYEVITEAGDAANQVSGWAFSNVSLANDTTSGVCYWGLEENSGTVTVTVYKDSAGTNPRCGGSTTTDNGTITLTPQSGSTMYGTVTLDKAISGIVDDSVAVANTLTFTFVHAGTPLYAKEYRSLDGNYYPFLFSTTKAYRLGTTKAVTDIPRSSGGDYTASANRWDTAFYVNATNEYVVATNYNDDVQLLTSLTSANFAVLGGSPPKAKYCLVSQGHLILANVNDGTARPKKVIWSGRDDLTAWTASLTTGAGSQVLAEADGQIVGLANVGGNFAVFHENAVSMGYYVGGNYTFRFEVNKFKDTGCIPGAPISVGNLVYWWGKKDMYVTDGSTIQPIGLGIRETVLNSVNKSGYHRITVMHDPARNIIYWSYPSTTADSSYTPNKILAYNYITKRFTQLDVSVNALFDFHTGALNPDAITTPSDDISAFSDSDQFQASGHALGARDTTSRIVTFTASNIEGCVEKVEYHDGNIWMADRVRARIKDYTGNETCQIGGRMDEDEAVSYGNTQTISTNGYFHVRKSGRYLRAKICATNYTGIPLSISVDVKKIGEK